MEIELLVSVKTHLPLKRRATMQLAQVSNWRHRLASFGVEKPSRERSSQGKMPSSLSVLQRYARWGRFV
jgi:hypothetical protein